MVTRHEIKQDVAEAIQVLDAIMLDLICMGSYFGDNLPKSEEREKLGVAFFDAARMVKISQTVLRLASEVQ